MSESASNNTDGKSEALPTGPQNEFQDRSCKLHIIVMLLGSVLSIFAVGVEAFSPGALGTVEYLVTLLSGVGLTAAGPVGSLAGLKAKTRAMMDMSKRPGESEYDHAKKMIGGLS